MMGFGYEFPFSQAAIFIYQLLKNHKDEDTFILAKELMVFPPDFKFAYNINNWLRTGERAEDKLFTEEQYQELAKILTERATTEAGNDSIFEKFPENIYYIINAWEERDKVALKQYTNNYLNKGKEKVINLLKVLVPIQRSTSREGDYKTDISKKQYEYIISNFDKNDLYERILKNYSIEEIELEEPFWIDMSELVFTEINMVRQYVKWYKQERSSNNDSVI